MLQPPVLDPFCAARILLHLVHVGEEKETRMLPRPALPRRRTGDAVNFLTELVNASFQLSALDRAL